MNLWRYLGISLFLVGTLCFISTTKLPVFAGGQEKDKKDAVKDKDKKDDTKDKAAKKDDTKDKKDDKTKTKQEEKKQEEKKQEEKKQEPKVESKKGGESLPFTAFDPKSKPFYQVQTTNTTQKLKVMNQDVDQKQEQTFVIKWTPKEMKGDNYVVEQQIEGVKMKIDIGGNVISYDSNAKGNPKNPMTDFFEQLTKHKLTFTINKNTLKVDKIEGREEFIKGLSDINPQMKGLLNAILSDKALVKMAEPTWYAYPEGGTVDKGQTWKKESNLDLGPIGNYKTDFTFTYKGQEGSKDKIEIKTALSYTAPTEKVGLPFIIQKANLSSESGSGEAIFDRSKGRFESTKLNMKLSGQLTIEVGNMTTTVDLNQTQEATSVTRDDNPWEKKGS